MSRLAISCVGDMFYSLRKAMDPVSVFATHFHFSHNRLYHRSHSDLSSYTTLYAMEISGVVMSNFCHGGSLHGGSLHSGSPFLSIYADV